MHPDADGSPDLHPERSGTRWPRELLLRGLGFVYLFAFLAQWDQALALFGHDGLTPADLYLERVQQAVGPGWSAWSKLPTIFWLDASDGALMAGAGLGVLLSAALLAGVRHALVPLLLWVLYLGFVGVGQLWMGYGWESLLLEAGFLAIFLCPWTAWRPDSPEPAGTAVVLWLYRWLAFRLMLGAGLIKIRGDECWRELSCLQWHFETQPNPHPLSILWHHLPAAVLQGGVAFNHLVELVLPFALLGPRALRAVAVPLMVLFQGMLVLSGNLSFLNWLTAVLCLSALDDRIVARLTRRLPPRRPAAPSRLDLPRKIVVAALALFVGVQSIEPVANLLSREQVMNRSYDPLRLVNTYGMFGSVHDTRLEVVIQGRQGDGPWLEYELPCKPGDPDRRPCFVTPYHLRLDWQLWFVQFGLDIDRHPWLVHLVWKLLQGDPGVRTLLAQDPFDGAAPDEVRLAVFEYHFVSPGEPGWWTRQEKGLLLPAVSADTPELRAYVRDRGWLRDR